MPFELRLQILFEGKIEERVQYIFLLFLGDLGYALALEVLILWQRGPEHELQIPAAREVSWMIRIVGRFDGFQVEAGAGLRVPERLFALLQRKQHHRLPVSHGVEVLGGLQRVTQIAGPWHHELIGAMALAHHVFGFRQLLPPSVGSDRLLGDVAIEDRAPAGLGYLRAKLSVPAKLDDATPNLIH